MTNNFNQFRQNLYDRNPYIQWSGAIPDIKKNHLTLLYENL